MKTYPYVFRKILSCVLFLVAAENGFAQQVEKGLTAANGTRIGFLEYKPSDYATSPTTKYPVIIFFHGIGERGNGTTELYKVKRAGIPRYIDKGHKMRFFWNGKWETFLVLSPQLAASYGNWQNFYGEAMIAYARKNLRIDTNRVYMAGLSLGGGGVWSYASGSVQNAQKLAAIAPACGVCTMSNGCNIANADLPVWAEHASDDPTVSVSCTINSIAKIKACNPGIAPIKVIYPTGGHAIWDRLFDTAYTWHDVNVYEWFLGQNKSLKPNKLPVAKATGNTALTLADPTTTLSASTSSDADGKLVKYIWKQLNGPDAAVIQNRNAVNTLVSGFGAVGKYQFELTVVDNRANWNRDTVTLNVTNAIPVNKAPIAAAGDNQHIVLPINDVTLDGTASSDPDGTISKIEWLFVSGPSTPAISRPGSLITDVTGLIEGTYVFKLVVTDDKGLTNSDNVYVVVEPIPNQAPVVKAGGNQVIYLPTDSVYVAGSAIDLDGTISSYKWKQVSGPAAAVFTNVDQWGTEIQKLVAGTYYFALFVTDNIGATASDTLVVTVKKAANQAPRITVTKTLTIQLPIDSAFVSANGSFDPDGSIESYTWRYLSGPDSSSIVDANSMETWVDGLKEGRYKFELTVADNLNEKVSDTIVIKVLAALNQAPSALAGKNISLVLPVDSTTLDGSGSTDPEGSSLQYLWTKIKGPAGETVETPGGAVTRISGLSEGVYYYQLQVTDNGGLQALDTIRVTVKGQLNLAPDADAGKNITILITASGAKLNGSQSSDVDGTIVSYHWRKLAGAAGEVYENADAAITLVSNLEIGSYSFELSVTDNVGAISTDTVLVKVNPKPIVPPVAIAGNDFTVTLPVDTVLVVANGSYDTDGTIKSYSWTILSSPGTGSIVNSNTANAGLINLVEGIYAVQVKVTDDDGSSGTDTVEVTVLPRGNTKPVANAGRDQSVTLPVEHVSLEGSKSYDPDGSIDTYQWTQVSGPKELIVNRNDIDNPVLTGMIPGDYIFRLLVTDDRGMSSADDVKLKVIKAPNKLPIANAGKDSVVAFGSDFQLNGSASFDPDGRIATYSWMKVSGPGGVTVVNSGQVSPMVTGVTGGKYVFRLTVMDNEGAETSDDVTMTVEVSVNKAPLAYAGKDTVISYPVNEIELSASGSMDFDGKIVDYVWNQVAGPQDAEISNTTAGATVVSGMTVGTYQFELIVHDNDGAISRDTVAVNVVNNLRIIDNALVYPNPAVQKVTLKLNCDENGQAVIKFYDVYGHLVLLLNTLKQDPILQQDISLHSLKPGLYLIQINIGDKKKMVTRLVKQ
ncbi:MAG TPA: PKD domain-containing protein [Flavitalea sp.]|nr:PKD domain-containing protein [Flavitalea sp.]